MIISNKLYDIPVVFREKFPDNYINDIDGWGIDEETLHSKNQDDTFKLLSLDIDYGIDCSLSCPHCFRKNFNEISKDTKNLTNNELYEILEEAFTLGLQYVKIIGAGEPFENKDLLDLIQFLFQNNIKVSIFTKGHIIGNDSLINKYFGKTKYQIKDSIALLTFLKQRNVSLLIGFNSFDDTLQNEFVGIKNGNQYIESRNQAIINAVKCGFNDYIPGKKTQLALIAAPIKPENIDEIFTIFKFGRIRNIYVVSCPTTISGLGKKEYKRESELMSIDKYIEHLRNIYLDIYKWSIEKNLIKIEEIQNHGISLYPGCHPCNQAAAGFYLTLAGKIYSCPGRDDYEHLVFRDARKSSLKEIWQKSNNYKLASETNRFNFYCVARDKHFFKEPKNFYSYIENDLLAFFSMVKQQKIESCN